MELSWFLVKKGVTWVIQAIIGYGRQILMQRQLSEISWEFLALTLA